MTLVPKESEELKFINILKSKHARYVTGGEIVSKDAVADDFVPPGAALGKITGAAKYGPVTRDLVGTGGADASANTIPLAGLNETDWHNWQVGDSIIIDPGESAEETAVITAVDEAGGTLSVDSISTAHAAGVSVQKNDGSSTAQFVCLDLIDLSEEDAIVGGITHGALYRERMPNYDEIVDADLPLISFEL